MYNWVDCHKNSFLSGSSLQEQEVVLSGKRTSVLSGGKESKTQGGQPWRAPFSLEPWRGGRTGWGPGCGERVRGREFHFAIPQAATADTEIWAAAVSARQAPGRRGGRGERVEEPAAGFLQSRGTGATRRGAPWRSGWGTSRAPSPEFQPLSPHRLYHLPLSPPSQAETFVPLNSARTGRKILKDSILD